MGCSTCVGDTGTLTDRRYIARVYDIPFFIIIFVGYIVFGLG